MAGGNGGCLIASRGRAPIVQDKDKRMKFIAPISLIERAPIATPRLEWTLVNLFAVGRRKVGPANRCPGCSASKLVGGYLERHLFVANGRRNWICPTVKHP